MRPGPLRQVRLVLGLGVRRWLNRVASGFAAKLGARGAAAVVRPPTARRRISSGAVMALFLIGAVFQVGFSMWMFGQRAAAVDGRPPVRDSTWASARSTAAAAEPGWQQRVREQLAGDRAMRELPEELRDQMLTAAVTLLATPAVADADEVLHRRIAHLTAALLAMVAVCAVILPLGMANTDLAKPDWDELWLAAQPVSDRVLFTARLVQYTLLGVLVWMAVPAAVAVLAISNGASWQAGVGLGLVAGLAWAVTAAAIRLVIEIWLRQHLAHARIKNLQAGCTVLGMAAMVAMYGAAMGYGPLPGWFLDWAGLLPWSWLPSGWASVAALQPEWRLPLVVGGLAIAAAAAVTAVQLCTAWSSGGLIAHDGTLNGARQGPPGRWRPMRVLGKDLLLLRRDRALLVQALVMPLFMIALQLVLNPTLAATAVSGFHAAVTSAVALGGWVLVSATMALAFEGQALWILAGAPQPLAHAIRGKVVMWAIFATGYAVAGLVVITTLLPWPGATALADIVMVLTGLPLLAVLAVGIGAAATDPQSTQPNRRVGPGSVYLYMLVMGLFSLTVNRGSAHQRLAMLVLLAVIAWALWQRLRDRLAYLFEPIDRPPRQVDLADGAWAAFAFLVLQGLIAVLLLALEVEPATSIVGAFALAGGITALATLLTLWRSRVPQLLTAVGLRPPPGTSVLRTVVTGLVAGGAAAVFAGGYLTTIGWLAPRLPALHEMLEQAGDHPMGVTGWHMVALAVVLAPLCEEFIFRGLLFRGLRRDLPLVWAAAASAAVFAIIHPSLGVIPVFGLGLACALAYARTGWLLAPIVAHALYNGVVVLLSGG